MRSVLLSVMVLLTGHRLQLTLLPLKAQSLDCTSELIGLIGSANDLGFAVGCLRGPRMDPRIPDRDQLAAPIDQTNEEASQP